jgi:hypothetical protein
MRTFCALLALFVIQTQLSVVKAVDVFGNGNRLSSTTSASENFSVASGFALPFTTGTSLPAERALAGAWVLAGGNTEIAITFTVQIFADAGSNQGPTGAALATGSLNLPTSTMGWQYVEFTSPINLDANSNYYIAMIETTGLGDFLVGTPDDNPGYSNLGSGSDYALTSGGDVNLWALYGSTWTDTTTALSDFPIGYQLVTAVPEPSTYALGAVAVMMLGGIARRRNKV